MANKINLRLYQEELLAKIQAKETSGDDAANSYLGVMVGQDYVLVNLKQISEVVPMPEFSSVPLTKSWFLGLANIRGNLYAVSDLSALVKDTQSVNSNALVKSSEARLLLLSDSVIEQAGLLVNRVIGLLQLSLLKPVQHNNHAKFCYSQQYEDNQGRVWNELNMPVLVDSNVFLQPSLV